MNIKSNIHEIVFETPNGDIVRNENFIINTISWFSPNKYNVYHYRLVDGDWYIKVGPRYRKIDYIPEYEIEYIKSLRKEKFKRLIK